MRLIVAIDEDRGSKAQVAQADFAVVVDVKGRRLDRVVYMCISSHS